jgi:hypothetical protein
MMDSMINSDYGNFLRIYDLHDTGYDPENEDLNPSYLRGQDKKYIHGINKEYDQTMQDIEDSYEVHLHFWVKFTNLDFNSAIPKFGINPNQGEGTDAYKFQICFLAFGQSEKCKNLTFSIDQNHQLVVQFTPGEGAPKDINKKRYYMNRARAVQKMVSLTKLKKNKEYFIDFAIFKYAQLSETQLFINCKKESTLSFSERPILRFKKIVFGSEIHSFPFEGVISDCAIVYNNNFNESKKSTWGNKLLRYHQNYQSNAPGSRLDCLEVDCDLRNCVNSLHENSGVPKMFLKKYEYNEDFRMKMLMVKLKIRPDTMEPVSFD